MATKAELEQELAQLKQQLAKAQDGAKVGVNLTLPLSLRDRLKTVATNQRLTMSEITTMAITNHLDQLQATDNHE